LIIKEFFVCLKESKKIIKFKT